VTISFSGRTLLVSLASAVESEIRATFRRHVPLHLPETSSPCFPQQRPVRSQSRHVDPAARGTREGEWMSKQGEQVSSECRRRWSIASCCRCPVSVQPASAWTRGSRSDLGVTKCTHSEPILLVAASHPVFVQGKWPASEFRMVSRIGAPTHITIYGNIELSDGTGTRARTHTHTHTHTHIAMRNFITCTLLDGRGM